MYRSEAMTVKALKEYLKNVPDDTPVVITEDFQGVAYHSYYDKDEKTFCIDCYEEELEDDPDWE